LEGIKISARTYGALARRVDQRFQELLASENMESFSAIPGLRCHPLVGNRKGVWSVDLSGNMRLLFIPDHKTLPVLPDGSLNRRGVTAVKILSIEDTH
jgi:proteic killer suppression protein